MAEKGEYDQHQQHLRQILLAVSVIVLEMISMVLEHIVVLVLNLPPGATGSNDGRTVCSVGVRFVAKAL